MDPILSRVVVIALATIASVAWLAGFLVLMRASQERMAQAQQREERFDDGSNFRDTTIVGVTDVDGSPDELSAKLGRLLARDGLGPLSPVKIISCHPREVLFEVLNPDSSRSSNGRHGSFRLVPAGYRTRVQYAVEASCGRPLIAFG